MSKAECAKKCRHFVLDMDGTFYMGDTILPRSMEFLEKVRETGRDFIFFTNNSSKSGEVYIEKLKGMGCEITADQIMTSGDVTAVYLNKFYPGVPVYLVGTAALEASFRKAGINLVEEGARIVVIGFDTTLTYEKLVKACDFLREGALYIATHPDINCPVEGGFIPDVGSFCALIEKSVGGGIKPKVLGKPNKETLEMVLERTGWKREETAFVGDRIYTDVATGVNGNAMGFLVLSGEADMQTVADSDIIPSAIWRDLGEIGDFLE